MVYVDQPRKHAGYQQEVCHMMADTVLELHGMAAWIGCKRSEFQDHKKHPHYDLPRSLRAAAIRAGAKPVIIMPLHAIGKLEGEEE